MSVFMIVVAFWFTACGDQGWKPDHEWVGSHCPRGECGDPYIDLITGGRKFNTVQDCMAWGFEIIRENPSDAFECTYGCRWEGDLHSVVCRDSTNLVSLEKLLPECINEPRIPCRDESGLFTLTEAP